MSSKLYHYRAELIRVYDGDTVIVDIDLGMGVWVRGQRIRLYGINAPELRREGGQEAKQELQEILALSFEGVLVVQTIKDKKGKYGRWLGVLWIDRRGIEDDSPAWESANDTMVMVGKAVYRDY